MKIAIILQIASTILLLSLSQAMAADNNTESDFVVVIRELETLPEEDIDIGNAALALAKDIHPDLDIEAYSARIDSLAEKVKKLANGSKDPDIRVRSINTVLYWEEGIEYDLSDPLGENIDNRLISGIMDTKKGSCVSMPLLYLAIAQRLGYPIYPVIVPQHTFLRYVDAGYKTPNIETTSKGGYLPDDGYIEWLQISTKAIESGTYLRTITYHEYLGELIAQSSIYWGNSGYFDRGLYYMATARRMYPKSADICQAFGMIMMKRVEYLRGDAAARTAATGMKCLEQAEIMGVTQLSKEDYVRDIIRYRQEKGTLK